MRRGRWLHWAAWAGVIGGATLLLLLLRERLDKAHIVLVYLLVILAGSVQGGRRLGLALAGVAFLLFNWFFLGVSWPHRGSLDSWALRRVWARLLAVAG